MEKKKGEVWESFVARLAEAYNKLTNEEKDTFLGTLEKMLSQRSFNGIYAIVSNAVTNMDGIEICDGMTVLDASSAPIKVYDIERNSRLHKVECEGMLDAALTLIKRISGTSQERKELCMALLDILENK